MEITSFVVEAFNRWNDDAINNPDRYQSIAEIITKRLQERLSGAEPTYGDAAAETLWFFLDQINEENKSVTPISVAKKKRAA